MTMVYKIKTATFAMPEKWFEGFHWGIAELVTDALFNIIRPEVNLSRTGVTLVIRPTP